MKPDPPPTRHPPWRSPALWALAGLTLLRLAAAAAMPLAPDEAYYWVWSRALAPGYLDHPPMVALWIRLGTALAGDTALGLRLLAPLSAAAGTLLLFDAAHRLFGRPAALRAAILLNATLMLGAGAITLTPDTPLLFFWNAALWSLARLAPRAPATRAPAPRAPAPWFLVFGAAAGLALDSKYTAALLGLGAALWLLHPANRPWLRTPWPYAAALLATALFSPVLLWNHAHNWASLTKQGARTADWHPAQAPRYLAELLAGQFALATPLIALLFAAGTAATFRQWRNPRMALPAAFILPGLAVFLQHAIGDRVQANWVAILYPAAALAAATLATPWWRPAAALGAVLTALATLQATLHPIPFAADPTLRLAGWPALAQQAAAQARQSGAQFIASQDYGPASLLTWSAPGTPVIAAAPRWSLFDLPPATATTPGLLLIPARHAAPPDPNLWQSAAPAGTLTRTRAGYPLETFRLYTVTLRPGAPAVVLPTPRSEP